jgi:pyrimidine-nucleoside phosphorylase
MMGPVHTIRKKRDGHRLDRSEIDAFVRGVITGEWSDYQAAALLMAIFLKGMDDEETADLTQAMVSSGQRLDFSDLPGPKIDKHSTGGVGDKTSLILAPIVAACGVYVPMMSGRGLGHSGGTLDKLEAIPGFRVHLPLDEFRAAVREVGCALVGATAEIAPADKKLYALRDVTGTVESIPLITASILSKKIAEGINGLVMDVKCGSGAFMKHRAEARDLAHAIVANGKHNGVRTEALITDMSKPLGAAVGNALEIKECLAVLRGEQAERDLVTLSLKLAERMLALAGADHAMAQVEAAVNSGKALEKFRQIVERQGGDPRICDDPNLLPTAPKQHLLRAGQSGYLASIDAFAFGDGCMRLGAGRTRVDHAIDPSVGAVLRVKPGVKISSGDILAEIHYRDEEHLAAALPRFAGAFHFAPDDTTLKYRALVLETVS